jgi:AraC-like DNA-binding protein
VLPYGSVELLFNLHADIFQVYDRHDPQKSATFGGSLLSGPHSEASVIDRAHQTCILGVSFQPGGAVGFFGLPPGETHNLDVPLAALWGTSAALLREQLLYALTPAAKFAVLEKFLLARLKHNPTLTPAIAFAVRQFERVPQNGTIADVIGQTGFSQRHFIQLFSREVGLPPKLFCRIRRFQVALHQVARQPEVELTKIAHACGYFDQSHFIHDFRAFSGMRPSEYFASVRQYPNHVPLAD